MTICAQDRRCLFGSIVSGVMQANDAGRMVATIWEELSTFYAGVDTGDFIVMPNHFHGIVIIVGVTPCGHPKAGQARGPAPTGMSLPDVIHRLKTMTTRRYAKGVKEWGWTPFNGRLWQRNYYDRIVRNEDELLRIREYIAGNPAYWADDEYNVKDLSQG
ncbi:MAG: transposase [Vicinamibacteria bacterium]|nr:transposase [Vicinamibacteria bacterium]